MNKVIWHADAAMSREVLVSSNQHLLSGELKVPQNASGIVLFAHKLSTGDLRRQRTGCAVV